MPEIINYKGLQKIIPDPSGNHGTTLTWNSAYIGSTTLPLPSALISTAAGKVDLFMFVYHRALNKWLYIGQFGGYN